MVKCSGGFTSGDFKCIKDFEGEVPGKKVNKSCSFSILMGGKDEFCNMGCSYCCCRPVPAGCHNLYNEFEKDFPKMISKIKSSPLYVEGGRIHFDIWKGEPLFNLEALKETVTALRTEWPHCSLGISSNGLLLGAPHIIDYLIENRIGVQLSHDGWGQWIRSKVDPLDNERILEGLKRLSDAKLFSAVNCTLSYYNSSWYKNIDYWLTHLINKGIRPTYIKLNHIYNSDYNIEAINEEGRWQDGVDPSLKGTPIGNMALRGRVLDDYLQEFFTLAMFFRRTPEGRAGDLELFRSYIMEQSKRYGEVLHDNEKELSSAGACRSYQSWKHDVEGNFKQDWTFVITTTGEYAECNLCNEVSNPGSPMAKECKNCKYKWQKECHGCGSMQRPNHCEYNYKWCQCLERLYLIDKGPYFGRQNPEKVGEVN